MLERVKRYVLVLWAVNQIAKMKQAPSMNCLKIQDMNHEVNDTNLKKLATDGLLQSDAASTSLTKWARRMGKSWYGMVWAYRGSWNQPFKTQVERVMAGHFYKESTHTSLTKPGGTSAEVTPVGKSGNKQRTI